MALISLLHRWAGGFIGLLLALIGLSGAILLWEGSWIALPGASDPVVESPAQMARLVDEAAASGMSRITFASEEIGLHQVVNSDGSGAYVNQQGTMVASWNSEWGRPELWLFDFHHHLFAGRTGETITGIAGAAGMLFVLTGVLLWWRSPAKFRPTLLPKRLQRGAIVKHHRDLGVLVSPLLLLSMGTGVMMLFAPVRQALIGSEQRPSQVLHASRLASPGEAVLRAKALFPDAALRRIVLPAAAGGDIVVRMKQDFEWTPQGRTQLSFAPNGSVTIENAAAANAAASATEKLYPIHAAKVGGIFTKLIISLSGAGLFLLGSFSVYAFWLRKAKRRRPVQSKIERSSFSLGPNQIT